MPAAAPLNAEAVAPDQTGPDRRRKRLQRAIWPLLLIAPMILALTWASMEVLSVFRASIMAQGHWVRAQQEAVIQLLHYTLTADEASYNAFQDALHIPLAHRRARLALQQQPPQRDLAREAFVEAGSLPADADRLNWLYLNRELNFVDEVAEVWQRSDAELLALQHTGARLHELMQTGDAPAAILAVLTTDIRTINARLVDLQRDFARILGDGFQYARKLLFLALSVISFALLALAWLSTRRTIARLVQAEEKTSRAERRAAHERERALVTLQSIGDAVITADAQGRIDYLNPVAEKLTGWRYAEAIGRRLEEVVRIVGEGGSNPVAELPQRILREGGPIEIARNATLIRRDGSEVAIAESASRIRARSGEALGIVIVFRDVTRERRMAAQLSYHASHDLLTGLVNRREFERRLNLALQSSVTERRSHAVLFIDLDRFKAVNDACGHAAGDRLLRQVSHLFAAALRESDTLARLGGDEFGVLLENCSVEDAARIAEELRRGVAAFRFVSDGRAFAIGASIGVVPLGHCTPTVQDVMSAADQACYSAKSAGRNRIEMYTPEHDAAPMPSAPDWGRRITQALADNRLRLHAQELLPLQAESGDTGPWLEVYVRLEEPDGGLAPPGAFLHVAERMGLMSQIDSWVIDATLAYLRECRTRAEPLPVCIVNLSAATLADKASRDAIAKRFDSESLGPHIVFELSESTLMANMAHARSFMEAMRARGCLFCLDEFGHGMLSFSYLRNLPVDLLRVDGLLIRSMRSDQADALTVEALARIARALGKRTIATMVEDEEILPVLRVAGIDFAQGYAISPVRPVPLDRATLSAKADA